MLINFNKSDSRAQVYESARSKFMDGLHAHNHCAHENKAFIPAFAFNDEQLRLVLCHRAWRYVHHNGTPPEFWDYEAVNKMATEKALAGHDIDDAAPDRQREMQADHRKAVRRAGGYMELQASIAFKSWRLGMPSPEVAVACRVSPWMVRQSLRRLRGIAARLGFEVGRRHHSLRAGTYNPSNGISA